MDHVEMIKKPNTEAENQNRCLNCEHMINFFMASITISGLDSTSWPDLITLWKLSRVGPGQYLDGKSPRNNRVITQR